MPTNWNWRHAAGISLAVFMALAPYVYYRIDYNYAKRLRTVTEGRVYRSGTLTADGFVAALDRYKIKTVINFKDESPDPELCRSFFDFRTVKESELCQERGVNYRFLFVDCVNITEVPEKRPEAIDKFLALMDDEANYPVLIHCQAGLHRTGVMAAVYRMEYEHWTKAEALRELKQAGFGEFYSSAANEYIVQYIMAFEPRQGRIVQSPTSPTIRATPASLSKEVTP